MHSQYCVQNKRIDLYFSEHKLGIKIDEYRHVERDFECKKSSQIMIDKKLNCRIIRTDPDAADFNIYRLINQVQ